MPTTLQGAEMGGTCVNRGCVPSKVLLAAAGRIRDMKNTHHLKARPPLLPLALFYPVCSFRHHPLSSRGLTASPTLPPRVYFSRPSRSR